MSIEAVIANQIIDASTVGKNALTAVDAAAFRATIGAGTSSFDGAYSSLSGVPSLLPISGGTLTGSLTLIAGTTATAPINIPQGSAPTSPLQGDMWYAGSALFFRVASTTRSVAWSNNINTWTVTQTFVASQSNVASINITPGNAKTTSFADGDIWLVNAAGMFVRINGATEQFCTLTNTVTLTNKTLTAPVISTITNAGTITLPTASTTLVGRDTTDTLTNKRLQRRIVSTTSATTLTPDISAADFYEYTALAAGLTINDPSGTPVNGELLNFRLQDNGTGRAITWGAQFRSMTATLPTTTVANKTHRILCEWNSGDSTWDCLAVSAQP